MARTKALSQDLRWVLVHMRHLRHLSVHDIEAATGVNKRTIQRVLQNFGRMGDVAARPRSGSRQKLHDEAMEYIQGCIEHSPDIYLTELQRQIEDMCNITVSPATVWRSLARLGFTLKKITKVAMERNEEKRMSYMFRMGALYEPEQLVFVDESSFDRRTTYRGYAWALKGRRAVRSCFYVRGKRYSVLPALSMDGMLYCRVIDGAFNTERFSGFIDGLLDQMQPYPGRNSVIVMDNARIHKSPEMVDMIRARGMRVEFLPTYSPDFNPIEQAFSVIKAHVRRHYPHFARSSTTGTNPEEEVEAHHMLLDAVYAITPDHAQSFFRHSGYI